MDRVRRTLHVHEMGTEQSGQQQRQPALRHTVPTRPGTCGTIRNAQTPTPSSVKTENICFISIFEVCYFYYYFADDILYHAHQRFMYCSIFECSFIAKVMAFYAYADCNPSTLIFYVYAPA